MLLTDKAKAILIIVMEVLLTLMLIAGSVCIAVLVQYTGIKIVALVFMLLIIAHMGVIIGATVYFYIDEL